MGERGKKQKRTRGIDIIQVAEAKPIRAIEAPKEKADIRKAGVELMTRSQTERRKLPMTTEDETMTKGMTVEMKKDTKKNDATMTNEMMTNDTMTNEMMTAEDLAMTEDALKGFRTGRTIPARISNLPNNVMIKRRRRIEKIIAVLLKKRGSRVVMIGR